MERTAGETGTNDRFEPLEDDDDERDNENEEEEEQEGGEKVDTSPSLLQPIVLLALEDHWTCSLLHAELIERGYDAACVMSIAAAIVASAPIGIARARVLVVEDRAIAPQDRAVIQWIRILDPTRMVVLLTSAIAEIPEVDTGLWSNVLRRPIPIGALASIIEGYVDRVSAPNQSERPPPSRPPPPGFELRVGLPWPMIRCTRCNTTRHCEVPRTPAEKGIVLVALVTFGLDHSANCHGEQAESLPLQDEQDEQDELMRAAERRP